MSKIDFFTFACVGLTFSTIEIGKFSTFILSCYNTNHNFDYLRG